MMVHKSRHAPPKASVMIEALRGLGYSLPAAIADIIDNSITAKANVIEITFSWKESGSTISILDNGTGMSGLELDKAMRLGERNPLEDRSLNDLGRFGLGLKTASFSQSRRLTVATIKNCQFECLRWDLDYLAECADGGWHLLEGADPNSEKSLDSLRNRDNGTMVLWEVLDRIVTKKCTPQNFLDIIDLVENHLSLVFHRFLADSESPLLIKINGRAIKPIDPFLLDHPFTWSSPVERIPTPGGLVEVQCHVLPHKDKLSHDEFEMVSGIDGWTSHQGFYVYRNKRLLVDGHWLGLGTGKAWTKDESFRLARIRLDIPNTADADWKIDIRKSKARPPTYLKEKLTRLGEATRERARRVFAHRGKYLMSQSKESIMYAWRAEHFTGGIRYRIDRKHPVILKMLKLAASLEPQMNAMLRVIEETVPVQRIWLDTTEAKETPCTEFYGESSENILGILRIIYKELLLEDGMSPESARKKLLTTEPFNLYPDLVSTLSD